VRVLVVDDDEDARYILGHVLTYAGALVRTAASAREAVMALDDGRDEFDVIVTDYSMPGDTGLRLLAHARDRPRPVPVIALTGYAGMQVQELDAAPFARVLGKPIDPWRLCREVRDVVGRA
jgi:CheY-like chemotaxis protein